MPDLVISPPTNLGVLGGGQLGRMFVVAARTMGYHTVVLDPDPQSPAGQIADKHICATYKNTTALGTLIKNCVAVTVEFENVPTSALEYLQDHLVVSPSSNALAISQNRIHEKRFIQKSGVGTVAFEEIQSDNDIVSAFERLSAVSSLPHLLKSARWGYDGKHQREVTTLSDIESAIKDFGCAESILEEKVVLEREISVIVVRSREGETRCYPVVENEHQNGILHLSATPACIDSAMKERVYNAAITLVEAMDYCGVLGVELFITTDGRLLVNEMAPRPHNSGHYTIDACNVSQFEQQVRAMCGLPVGDTKLLSPSVMVNLLGDLWRGGEPRWKTLLCHPNLKLHLYGKTEARPRRKMGHFCVVGDDIEQLRDQAKKLFKSLQCDKV